MVYCKRYWKELFLGRIVMVAQKIVRLHDLDIVNLCRLQNLTRTFRPVMLELARTLLQREKARFTQISAPKYR